MIVERNGQTLFITLITCLLTLEHARLNVHLEKKSLKLQGTGIWSRLPALPQTVFRLTHPEPIGPVIGGLTGWRVPEVNFFTDSTCQSNVLGPYKEAAGRAGYIGSAPYMRQGCSKSMQGCGDYG
jgi:hypothetical protein